MVWSCHEQGLGLDETTALVGERADENHDEVDEPEDAENTTGEKHQDACADLADVEAVHAEHAEEDAEKKSDDPVLVACVGV